MINVFRLNKSVKLRLFSDDHIWANVDSLFASSEMFENQGPEHENIDLQLIDDIDNILEPILGECEGSERWSHSLLCNGDGIRAVSINYRDFTNDVLLDLKALLKDECIDFCILCNIHENFGSVSSSRIGTILIKSNEVVLAKEIQTRSVEADAQQLDATDD